MEKHATDDGDKATYVMICIQDRTSAAEYAKKHNLKNVVHVVARPPTEYVVSLIYMTIKSHQHSHARSDTTHILEHTDTNCHTFLITLSLARTERSR